MSEPLLEVKDLTVRFPIWGGVFRHKVAEVRAVDRVSLTLYPGETLGLVGESGCGKSTIAKAIINILKFVAPGVIEEGQILFHRQSQVFDLLKLSRRRMKPFRSMIQMVFQDPFSSLNPRMTIRQIVEAPLRLHTAMTANERRDMVHWLLERCGLSRTYASRYPHEFSGGQRQRVGIARALAGLGDVRQADAGNRSKIVIADEPVSALDVSVQGQVINLFLELQEELGLTYLFVAHDLSLVHHISDRIAVMYLGSVVELGNADTVYTSPSHPYSRALLSAVPQPIPRRDRTQRIRLQGEIPSPLAKPSGCGFRTRCPMAREECAVDIPALETKPSGQLAACPFT